MIEFSFFVDRKSRGDVQSDCNLVETFLCVFYVDGLVRHFGNERHMDLINEILRDFSVLID